MTASPQKIDWRKKIIDFGYQHRKNDLVTNVALAAMLQDIRFAEIVALAISRQGLKKSNCTAAHIQTESANLLMRGPAQNLYLWNPAGQYRLGVNVESALLDYEHTSGMSDLTLFLRLIGKRSRFNCIWRYLGVDLDSLRSVTQEKIGEELMRDVQRSLDANYSGGTKSPDEILLDAAPGQYGTATAIGEILEMRAAGTLMGSAIAPCILLIGPDGAGQAPIAKTVSRIIAANSNTDGAPKTETKPNAAKPVENILVLNGSNYTNDHQHTELIGSHAEYQNQSKGGLLTNFLQTPGPKVVRVIGIDLVHSNTLDVFHSIISGQMTQDRRERKLDGISDTVFIFEAADIFEKSQEKTSNTKDLEKAAHDHARKILGDRFVDTMHRVEIMQPLSVTDSAALLKSQIAVLAEQLKKRGIQLQITDRVLTYLDNEFRKDRKPGSEIHAKDLTDFLNEQLGLPLARLITIKEIPPGNQIVRPEIIRNELHIIPPSGASGPSAGKIADMRRSGQLPPTPKPRNKQKPKGGGIAGQNAAQPPETKNHPHGDGRDPR